MVKATAEEFGGQVHIEQGANVDARFGVFWGSTASAATYGVYFYPHCNLRVASDPVATITGAGGDFVYAATGDESRAWNDTAGSYTGKIANTWALFYTVIGSGGMSNNAHDLIGNTHLLGAD